MRFNEEQNIKKLLAFIQSTYKQHYVGKQDVQVIDLWEANGSLETTARDTAIKYLARYGKKDGRNEKDLLKAMHYIILMMYVRDKSEVAEKSDDPPRGSDGPAGKSGVDLYSTYELLDLATKNVKFINHKLKEYDK